MIHVASPSLIRQLGSLFEGGSAAGLSDRQLLERFIARARSGRRGRLRRDGGPPRADGAGRLPTAPGRSSSCRGCLPGRLPRAGAQGPVDPRPRPARRLALRRAPSARLARPAVRLARRRQTRGRPGLSAVRRRRPPCQAEQIGDRPRAGRGPARRDRPLAEVLPPGGRALLLRGPHARRSRATAPTARPGPCAVDWSGRGRSSAAASLAAACVLPAAALAAALAPRSASASVSSPLCDMTTRAAIDFAAGQAGSPLGDGPCPGGAEIHAAPQAETHRVDLVVPRHRRHRRGHCGTCSRHEG